MISLSIEEIVAISALIDMSHDEFSALNQYFQKQNNQKGLELAAKFQETIKGLEAKLLTEKECCGCCKE